MPQSKFYLEVQYGFTFTFYALEISCHFSLKSVFFLFLTSIYTYCTRIFEFYIGSSRPPIDQSSPMPTSNVDTQNSTLLLSTSDWLLNIQLKLLMPTSDSEPTGFTIANIKLCSYRRETVGPTSVLTFSDKITAGPSRTIVLLKTPGSTTSPC